MTLKQRNVPTYRMDVIKGKPVDNKIYIKKVVMALMGDMRLDNDVE